ncbi:putative methyltransferase-domain-containing protein [Crucibulum laeve]|uniref:Putative methyltransferase-domain-containing protein n=1 Tax=Crucibulum laeve TaxID=68775 RepID=A0A5C3M439_9AGAR|nr:putative methyltransferase-domain-containing protein [Crucibulum laeve]
MVMESRNPNFPENMDILPSSRPRGILHDHQLGSDVFGTQAQEDAIRDYGIAGRVWEAAYALISYIHPPSQWEVEPPFIPDPSKREPFSIIELGSGVGIVAASIAERLETNGDDLIIATDLPEICPLLERNLAESNNRIRAVAPSRNGDLVIIRPLSWGNIQEGLEIISELCNGNNSLTHIICSDLVYFPELLAPLLRTLLQLTSTNDHERAPVSVIISYKLRSPTKEIPFWSAFGLWFSFEPVIFNDKQTKSGWQRFGASLDDVIFIFVAHRRADSFEWNIPTNDHDLLSGVGARGTASRKEDDTFESLLLMSLEEDIPE